LLSPKLIPAVIPDFNDIPCGCLITTPDRKLKFINREFEQSYLWQAEQLIGADISVVFSRASQIFSESYIVPQVYKEGTCREVQLTVLTKDGVRKPVVANITIYEKDCLIWIFMDAEKRDKLFLELESAQETLQQQKTILERLARTDALTGILNRRSFDEEVTRIFKESLQFRQAVSVLVIDIDHFKNINDSHGHQLGDQALTRLGEILASTIRKNNIVARYGGDEFVCVLSNTILSEALTTSERIHDAVRNNDMEQCKFTVSIGVACRTADERIGFEEVMNRADQALYRAKEAGRNRTFA
jgi:diguanylate cyclase (GGDEF)-like protein